MNTKSTASQKASPARTFPSLAVAIPCFRRPALLRELLISLVDTKFGSYISVYLLDDSPEKSNQVIAAEFESCFFRINYFHNVPRLGIDRNISRCLSVPREDFIWLLGEDDLVTQDSIAVVFSLLSERPDVNLLFINYTHFSSAGHRQPILNFESALKSSQDYIDNLLIYFGFIGSVLVKRSSLLSCADYLPFGTYFSHIGVIIDIIEASPINMLGIIERPIVLNRVGSVGSFSWGDDALSVYQGFGDLLEAVQNLRPELSLSLDKVTNQAFLAFHPLAKLFRILRLRSEGAISINDIDRLTLNNRLKKWLLVAPLLLIPKSLLRPLVNLYIFLR